MNKNRFFMISINGTQAAIFVSIITSLVLMLGTVLYNRASSVDSTLQTARLAIIIDDFGQQRTGVKEMLSLDCKITAAVMPFLEFSEEDARAAADSGKEVIIHLGMQATTHDNPVHIGPKPIKMGQSEFEIKRLVSEAVEQLPSAKGANIHMGTLCSSCKDVMRPVMQVLKENNMYFVDSKTSAKSVCKRIAREVDIDFFENEVFLEHEEKTKAYVKKRLAKAMNIAKEKGKCIAIGHVGVEGGMITVNAIKEMQQTFRDNNVELVFASELSD